MEHTKASVDVHKAQKKRREEQLKEMQELINSPLNCMLNMRHCKRQGRIIN